MDIMDEATTNLLCFSSGSTFVTAAMLRLANERPDPPEPRFRFFRGKQPLPRLVCKSPTINFIYTGSLVVFTLTTGVSLFAPCIYKDRK